MPEQSKCERPSEGWLLWPGREPTPMCSYHKEGPLRLARMMGWPVSFTVGESGPCESQDPHPDDKKAESIDEANNVDQ